MLIFLAVFEKACLLPPRPKMRRETARELGNDNIYIFVSSEIQ